MTARCASTCAYARRGWHPAANPEIRQQRGKGGQGCAAVTGIAHLHQRARQIPERHGEPYRQPEKLRRLQLASRQSLQATAQRFCGIGSERRREDLPIRCDDQVVSWNRVRAGCGLGGAQRNLGDADPLVERIAPFLDLPALSVWLTAAMALRQPPRLRSVFDPIARAFVVLPAPCDRGGVILAGMHPATPPLPHPLSEAERGGARCCRLRRGYA